MSTARVNSIIEIALLTGAIMRMQRILDDHTLPVEVRAQAGMTQQRASWRAQELAKANVAHQPQLDIKSAS